MAASLGSAAPKVLDASTAHRVAPGWVYGFAEMVPGQADRIAAAQNVANPGCYPTGAIGLIRPLVDAGLIPADYPITINAVSGYSGGGKAMIEAHEAANGPAFELYGLGLEHKHVAETELYGGLRRRPIFVPSVGHFLKGMLVSVPLHLDTLPGKPTGADLRAALEARYSRLRSGPRPPCPGRRQAGTRGAERHRPLGTFCLCQREIPSGGAGRAAGQPRQRGVGRGGAEHRADAGVAYWGGCAGVG